MPGASSAVASRRACLAVVRRAPASCRAPRRARAAAGRGEQVGADAVGATPAGAVDEGKRDVRARDAVGMPVPLPAVRPTWTRRPRPGRVRRPAKGAARGRSCSPASIPGRDQGKHAGRDQDRHVAITAQAVRDLVQISTHHQHHAGVHGPRRQRRFPCPSGIPQRRLKPKETPYAPVCQSKKSGLVPCPRRLWQSEPHQPRPVSSPTPSVCCLCAPPLSPSMCAGCPFSVHVRLYCARHASRGRSSHGSWGARAC